MIYEQWIPISPNFCKQFDRLCALPVGINVLILSPYPSPSLSLPLRKVSFIVQTLLYTLLLHRLSCTLSETVCSYQSDLATAPECQC